MKSDGWIFDDGSTTVLLEHLDAVYDRGFGGLIIENDIVIMAVSKGLSFENILTHKTNKTRNIKKRWVSNFYHG